MVSTSQLKYHMKWSRWWFWLLLSTNPVPWCKTVWRLPTGMYWEITTYEAKIISIIHNVASSSKYCDQNYLNSSSQQLKSPDLAESYNIRAQAARWGGRRFGAEIKFNFIKQSQYLLRPGKFRMIQLIMREKSIYNENGNSFFSLPKCKVVFVR